MDNAYTGQRPTFLTVLCIISFLWGAYSIYQSAMSAFTDAPQQDLKEARVNAEAEMARMDPGALEVAGPLIESTLEMAQMAADKAEPIGYTGLVQGLLGLLGVWMMWNLRRTGFWLYTVSGIVGLASLVVFFGTNTAAMISLGIFGFITILFIVLYAINLKHMS